LSPAATLFSCCAPQPWLLPAAPALQLLHARPLGTRVPLARRALWPAGRRCKTSPTKCAGVQQPLRIAKLVTGSWPSTPPPPRSTLRRAASGCWPGALLPEEDKVRVT